MQKGMTFIIYLKKKNLSLRLASMYFISNIQ